MDRTWSTSVLFALGLSLWSGLTLVVNSYSSKAFALTDQVFDMTWESLQTVMAIILASKFSRLHLNFRHLLWKEISCINGTRHGFPLLDLFLAWNCWEHSLSREPSKVPIFSSCIHVSMQLFSRIGFKDCILISWKLSKWHSQGTIHSSHRFCHEFQGNFRV